jgi:hypothetical protein
MNNQMNKNLLIAILIAIILFGILGMAGWLAWRNYLRQKVNILTDKTEYHQGESLKVNIKNNLIKNICFSSCYPYYLEREKSEPGSPTKIWEIYLYSKCDRENLNEKCIEPGKTKAFEINLSEYVEVGFHRIALPVCVGCKVGEKFKESKRFYSNEFLVKEKIRNF